MKHDTWPTTAPEPYLPRGAAARLQWLPTILEALKSSFRRAAVRIAVWHRRRRTLRELSKLDDRLLKDIGLSGGISSVDFAALDAVRLRADNENRRSRAA